MGKTRERGLRGGGGGIDKRLPATTPQFDSCSCNGVLIGPAAARQCHTPGIAFRHLPPNNARFGYASKVNMVLNVHRNRTAY